MSDLFLAILNMSITATYVIMAVILIRLPLRKAPRVFSYLLWLPVYFRLLCPISFQSAFSLLGALKKDTTYVPADIAYQANPTVNLGIEPVNRVINGSLPAATPAASVNPMGLIIELTALLWVVGILAFLAYGVISYLKLKRRVRFATLVSQGIYESDQVDSPFVMGFMKPEIYLPLGMTAEDRRYVLAHEQVHISRKDHLFKQLAYLALSLHWFNPLVHIAFRILTKDMEMSCDEAVMRELGAGARKGYSTSLINLSVSHRNLAAPLAFGESSIKSRIRNILGYRKPVVLAVVMAIVLVTTACIGLMGDPADSPDTSTEWVQDLLANRTPYVGDASKVGGITSRFVYPEGVNYGGVRLTTDEVPYSITVLLESEADELEQYLDQGLYLEQTFILFSLVENVEEVHFEFRVEGDRYSSTYTRTLARGQMDQALYAYSENQETFQTFLAELEDKTFLLPEQGFTVSYDSIEDGFMQILYSSQASSNPNDYLSAYPEEVAYLVSQGDKTLRYIYSQFEMGGQDGLFGHMYKAVAEEILDGEYVNYAEDTPPQYWYDLMKEAMQAVATQNSLKYAQDLYPKASLMLNESNYYYAYDMVMYADAQVEIGGVKLGYEAGDEVLVPDMLTPRQQEQMLFRAVLFCKEGLNRNWSGMRNFASSSLSDDDLRNDWKLYSEHTFPIGVRGPYVLDDGEYQVFVQIEEVHAADIRIELLGGEPRITAVSVFLP